MSGFARVEYAPIFHDLRRDVERLRDDILAEGGRILKRETQRSIRERWYRTGATLASLRDEVVSDGERKSYRLSPTATSKRGAPYPLFGEYGTGQRGRATGGPAPAGYHYGSQPGMAARRFGRLAIDATKPQVIRVAQEELIRYSRNQTVD
jgi:hypothetical protein